MKNTVCKNILLIFVVLCFVYPCYGQIELSFSYNGQIEQSCRDLQLYLISSDTSRIIEIPTTNNEANNYETISEMSGDSIWMAIIRYKKDYYMLGLISSADYRMLSPKSEIILLSSGFRKYDGNFVFIKGFKIIWRNLTTYGKSTYSLWKTKKECIENARIIFQKASNRDILNSRP